VAIWAGAEAGSIALFGFGLDSVIEVAAAAVLLWRLSVEARFEDVRRIERVPPARSSGEGSSRETLYMPSGLA
jgi:hypothetical protein